MKCLCPFHGDSRPSAAVSYKNDAFKCFACPAKGDPFSIIADREGISYREAIKHAERILVGFDAAVLEDVPGEPGRRLFEKSGNRQQESRRGTLRTRLRG